MIPRYANKDVNAINSDVAKLLRWQNAELAVILARVKAGGTTATDYECIKLALETNPPDVEWWKRRDDEVGHDLNAFIDERRRFIPTELQSEFHRDTTSFDTEEPAQARAFLHMCALVEKALDGFNVVCKRQAQTYQFTVMLERTHGQWGKLRSFGSRLLTWIAELNVARSQFLSAASLCKQSRIAGAMGNYGGGLTPELERQALQILGLVPFHGATQIMPRVAYAPLAQSLQLICEVLGKVALDVRLGARSGYPICHEPFGKKQKGSSAMPHKKNTILTEQMTGMARLASGYAAMLVANIPTWEARSIEQSSVERIAWPDLFHITLRMLSVMTRVLHGLAVYPDNMLREIVESRGTYASDEAKNFLALKLSERGIEADVAYRIVQLAAFNVLKPTGFWAEARQATPLELFDTDRLLQQAKNASTPPAYSIQTWIPSARLFPVAELEASNDDVESYNSILSQLFSDQSTLHAWNKLFNPSYLLKEEHFLFEKLLK
jgi:adenylosuccinate lyase